MLRGGSGCVGAAVPSGGLRGSCQKGCWNTGGGKGQDAPAHRSPWSQEGPTPVSSPPVLCPGAATWGPQPQAWSGRGPRRPSHGKGHWTPNRGRGSRLGTPSPPRPHPTPEKVKVWMAAQTGRGRALSWRSARPKVRDRRSWTRDPPAPRGGCPPPLPTAGVSSWDPHARPFPWQRHTPSRSHPGVRTCFRPHLPTKQVRQCVCGGARGSPAAAPCPSD